MGGFPPVILASASPRRRDFLRALGIPFAVKVPSADETLAPGEDPLEAARRELWEETGYVADRWSVLVDFLTTPGFCDEAIRIYLVRGARLADGPAHERHGEERDMTVAWAPLDELRDTILGGHLHNPSLLVGVLAACAARAADWAPLRPADDAWALGPRPLRDPRPTKD